MPYPFFFFLFLFFFLLNAAAWICPLKTRIFVVLCAGATWHSQSESYPLLSLHVRFCMYVYIYYFIFLGCSCFSLVKFFARFAVQERGQVDPHLCRVTRCWHYVLVLSSSKCSFETNQSPLDSVFHRGGHYFCASNLLLCLQKLPTLIF